MSLEHEENVLKSMDTHIQHDSTVQELLKSGLDLRHYSRNVEKELKEVENASIQDYVKESQNIASLHNQITSCDCILERMEDMLLGFQEHLGSISSDIESLQQQSVSMNVKLKNRQKVRSELSQFVDEMVVPDQMIMHILETPVTEKDFLEQLNILDSKMAFVKEQDFKDVRSCRDVCDVLQSLKLKAISKIREFLLQKIYHFRKPMTNYQIPQNTLIKHKFLFKFLMANNRQIASNIQEDYIDTVGKMYYSYFKLYASRLMKLKTEDCAGKDDVLGADDNQRKGLFASKPMTRSGVFSLGTRDSVINADLESPIIVPHTAVKSEQKIRYEVLFRSQQFALVDNTCREYVFLSEFFMTHGEATQSLFDTIFRKTTELFLKQVENFVVECYDSIGLFLCMHLVHRYRYLCHKRAVPALDLYWDAILRMLRKRFEVILNSNLESLQACDPDRFYTLDTTPHFISRRYAEYSAALVAINESFQLESERVDRLLLLLQNEMENLLFRMAAIFRDRTDQLKFLINNYDVMLAVLVEHTREDCKESETFKERLSNCTAEFVEHMLTPHFGALMQFVRDADKLMENNMVEDLRNQDRKVSTMIRTFNAGWKRSLDAIDKEIRLSFPNLRQGNQILQATLTSFLQYYHKFIKVLSLPPFKQLTVKQELINLHQLMVEVKKYKPAF